MNKGMTEKEMGFMSITGILFLVYGLLIIFLVFIVGIFKEYLVQNTNQLYLNQDYGSIIIPIALAFIGMLANGKIKAYNIHIIKKYLDFIMFYGFFAIFPIIVISLGGLTIKDQITGLKYFGIISLLGILVIFILHKMGKYKQEEKEILFNGEKAYILYSNTLKEPVIENGAYVKTEKGIIEIKENDVVIFENKNIKIEKKIEDIEVKECDIKKILKKNILKGAFFGFLIVAFISSIFIFDNEAGCDFIENPVMYIIILLLAYIIFSFIFGYKLYSFDKEDLQKEIKNSAKIINFS